MKCPECERKARMKICEDCKQEFEDKKSPERPTYDFSVPNPDKNKHFCDHVPAVGIPQNPPEWPEVKFIC